MNYKTTLIICMMFFTTLGFQACKKLVEVDTPTTSISSKNVYNNDATAIGAITSLYAELSSSGITVMSSLSSLSAIAGLSSDELSYYSLAGNPNLEMFYQNGLTSQNITEPGYWGNVYQRMYVVNTALEELPASNGLNPLIKQQLIGEAKFMRAFYYFYLINLYGDVPLVLNTDYISNSLIARSPKSVVTQQIINDLKDAEVLLSEKYLKGDGLSVSSERFRPTRWAAKTLLARVFLYNKEWQNAVVEATGVIENSKQFSLEHVGEVFLKESKEVVWQVQSVVAGINTNDAFTFILPASGPSSSNPVYLNETLVNEFGNNDLRKKMWINSVEVNGTTYNYPYKYKVLPNPDQNTTLIEANTVFRLAELFLIRSEARAQLDNLSGAITDIDEIRERAGIQLINETNPGISKDALLVTILKENQLEFFTEWGHRWLDLKRTGKIDEVMTVATPKKGSGLTWKSNQQYYPVSLSELNANPNLR